MTKWVLDIETLGLDSIFNRVICVTLMNDETHELHTFLNEDESEMLRQVFELITYDDYIVGFNSNHFDIPYLIKRAIINNLTPIKVIKWNSIDLREEVNSFYLANNIYDKGTLRDWATILGMKCETENGSQMALLWQNKEYDKIKAHNQEDVKITYELLKRLEGCGIVKWEG